MTTAAAQLAHDLTVAILRGDPPPGATLPTVRALAEVHGVNPATVQRALAALAQTGLVEVRHGSGTTVRDPAEVADLSVLPAWLEALHDRPDEASAMLADFLELRREVAAGLVVRHRDRLHAHRGRLAEAASAMAEAVDDLASFQAADLAFARTLLIATGNRAAPAVFATAARLVTDVPGVASAMYAEPMGNLASLAGVLDALDGPTDALRAAVLDAMATVDARTVRRYRAALEAA